MEIFNKHFLIILKKFNLCFLNMIPYHRILFSIAYYHGFQEFEELFLEDFWRTYMLGTLTIPMKKLPLELIIKFKFS